jgi:phage gp29-like protein
MAILDPYGQPIGSTKPPKRNLATIAVRDKWYTYPASGLTPERLARILKDADAGDMLQQAELFEEMEERDAHLASIFQTRKSALTGLDWVVEPFSDDSADKRVADAFRENWEALDEEDLLLELADAISKGVSFVALAWSGRGGRFHVTGFEYIHQKHWRYDYDLKRFVLVNDEHPMGEVPPFGSVIEHRHKTRSGAPTRAGVMRTCVWLYLFKNYTVKDWVAFAEVYGQPIRVGKYDPNTSKEEREALELAVSMIGSDAAGVISRDTEIQIIEAQKQSSSEVYDRLVAVCEAGQSRAVLGQTLTSSEGEHGTQALGKVHNEVRLDLMRADARAIAKTLRQQLVRPWAIFNFGAEFEGRVPYLTPQISDPEDLEATSRVIVNLTSAGASIPQAWVREKFGIPEAKAGEPVLGRPDPLARFERRAALEPPKPDPQGWVDALAQGATKAGAAALQRQLVSIMEAVRTSRDLEELQDRVARLVPELSQSELNDVLARAVFVADLFGRSQEV